MPRPRLLVVDDSPTARAWGVALAEELDGSADEAASCAEAVHVLGRTGPYDLVIVDFEMPEVAGPDTVRAIRQLEARSGAEPTRIVGLSADATGRAGPLFRAAGADSQAGKPLSLQGLAAELGACTERARAEETPQAVGGQPDDPTLDWDSALARSGLPAEVLLSVAETFAEEATEQLAAAASALASGRLVEVARTAHSLRGSAAVFVAGPTVEATLAVEQAVATSDAAATRDALTALTRRVEELLAALEARRRDLR